MGKDGRWLCCEPFFFLQSTCCDAKREVHAGRRRLPPQPVGLEAVEAVEVDEVGAAQAADDWEPTPVRSQSAGRTRRRANTSADFTTLFWVNFSFDGFWV